MNPQGIIDDNKENIPDDILLPRFIKMPALKNNCDLIHSVKIGGVLKKFLLVFGILLLVLALSGWFGGRFYLSSSVADYQGEISLQGISAPLEITFDTKGIPQVWAENDRDAYFALGWLHASERLFQMELIRRMVYGELSELLGATTYAVDYRQRQLGFARFAAAHEASLTTENRDWLQAYCQGINSWISEKSVLPPEFELLRTIPRDWELKDVLSVALYQTWYAHSLVDKDLDYEALLETFGPDLLPVLQDFKRWSPPTVHNSFISSILGAEPFPFRMSQASNSWAITPAKSASGRALHASDPHLRVDQVPGFWYIAGLHSKSGLNVLGITTPGMPIVAMGHNGKIAYSFTVATIDNIDYFRFQRHPEDSLQILTAEGYRPLKVISDSIAVSGEEKRPITLYQTSLGPVVESDSASVLVLKWGGFDTNPGETYAAAFQLHTTDNFQDFRKLVTGFGALDVNWIYSDQAGNIGYQLGTPIPIRNFADNYSVQNGADSSKHWQGYLPLEETPFLFNPAEGWLASCNNQVVSDQWETVIPGFYDPYRIVRANQLLSSQEIFSVKDMEDFQLDNISSRAIRWKTLLADGAERMGDSALAAEIRAWDGAMTLDSDLPSIYLLWWEYLAKPLFKDDLQDKWNSGDLIREEVLSAGIAHLIDDQRTPEKTEDAVDISAASLRYVLDTFGRPAYREISKLTVAHPFSRVPYAGGVIDSWLGLNSPQVPAAGDMGTLNANFNFWLEDQKLLYSAVGPSMRFVLDWAAVDSFSIVNSFGQSGNPFSPYYGNHFEMMQSGERWIVPFSKEKIYRQRASLLRLLPR